MTRIRDIERRFLEANGWTVRFMRRTSEWVWRNRNFNGNFSRASAFRLQMRKVNTGVRRGINSRLEVATIN